MRPRVLSLYDMSDVSKLQHHSRIGHVFAIEVEHITGDKINPFSGKVSGQYF